MLRFAALLLALALPSAIHAQTDEWKQLLNGKDLTAWKHVGPGSMTGYEVQILNGPKAFGEDSAHSTGILLQRSCGEDAEAVAVVRSSDLG